MFKYQVALSEKDYLDFNRYHAFNSPASKKYMFKYRFIVPIIFIFCGAGIGTMVDEPVVSYYFYIAFGIAAILWMIFFKWIMAKQIKKNIGKIMKSGKLPYQNEAAVSFEDDFIVETTNDSEMKVKYSAIERVVTNGEAFYIYINAVQAIILPFSVFTDESSRDNLLGFIEERRGGATIIL